MKDKKHIDRIFQEKFKDFEVNPPAQSWDVIRKKIPTEKQKRRVLPIWWQLGGVAAVFLIGLFTYNQWNEQENIAPKNEVAIPTEKSNSTSIEKNSVHFEDSVSSENSSAIVQSSEIKNSDLENSETTQESNSNQGAKVNSRNNSNLEKRSLKTAFKKNNEAYVHSDQTNTLKNSSEKVQNSDKTSPSLSSLIASKNSSTNTTIANNTNTTNSDSSQNQSVTFNNLQTQNSKENQFPLVSTNLDEAGVTAMTLPIPMGEILHEKESPLKVTNEQKVNRWQVQTHIAPIYLSSTGNGSPLDFAFKNNEKEYMTTFSYGVSVRYALNNLWTLRTGLNSLTTEFQTHGVTFAQGSTASGLSHLDSNIMGSMIRVESAGSPVALTAGNFNEFASGKLNGSISQRNTFYEVPMEASYAVFNQRFGLEVIGGFSTLFLKDDEVSLISGETEIPIGKLTNINSTHFSGNFGLGLSYRVIPRVRIRVEPMLKYQFNTYKNAGDYKPYFFGIYSGLNYQF